MYYNKQKKHYYENDEAVLRSLIYFNGLYKTGFSHWYIQVRTEEIMPGVMYTKKTFIIDCGNNTRHRETVYEITEFPQGVKLCNAENWIEYRIQTPNLLTEYGKKYYAKVLEHFKSNPTTNDLQINLFRG
jgi:hypothetical protein